MTPLHCNSVFPPSIANPEFSFSNTALSENPSHWRILLVEDVEISAKAIRWMLEKITPKVDWAQTAGNAQHSLSQNDYQLMVLDLGLPDMYGLELGTLIRQDSKWDLMRIVVLTAHGDERHLAEARQIGLNGFLQKPLTPEVCQSLCTWLTSTESENGFFTVKTSSFCQS